jgi:hypothetical protein
MKSFFPCGLARRRKGKARNSRTSLLFWILLWLASVNSGVRGVSAASLESYATAVAMGDQQRQALEHIRELADPSFNDLLIALKEGALYTWQGKLLILGDSGTFHDLTGQALLDASGQPLLPDDAEQVPLEEANIPRLAGCALSLIGTVDPEVGKTYIVDSFMVVVLGGSEKSWGVY